jgi:hypothetical protein
MPSFRNKYRNEKYPLQRENGVRDHLEHPLNQPWRRQAAEVNPSIARNLQANK